MPGLEVKPASSISCVEHGLGLVASKLQSDIERGIPALHVTSHVADAGAVQNQKFKYGSLAYSISFCKGLEAIGSLFR